VAVTPVLAWSFPIEFSKVFSSRMSLCGVFFSIRRWRLLWRFFGAPRLGRTAFDLPSFRKRRMPPPSSFFFLMLRSPSLRTPAVNLSSTAFSTFFFLVLFSVLRGHMNVWPNVGFSLGLTSEGGCLLRVFLALSLILTAFV